jgi:hypothetical protein
VVAERLGRLAARLVNAVEPAAAKVHATEFAQKLKAEYERGLAEERGEGDTGNPASDSASPAASSAAHDAGTPASGDAVDGDDVSTVAAALRSVDWSKVRAAAGGHSSEARDRMRSLAKDVDWGKVKSGAAVVSSALIAAEASGQIPLGGKLAGPVARAILNDSDLASKVSSAMGNDAQPPDLTADVKP